MAVFSSSVRRLKRYGAVQVLPRYRFNMADSGKRRIAVAIAICSAFNKICLNGYCLSIHPLSSLIRASWLWCMCVVYGDIRYGDIPQSFTFNTIILVDPMTHNQFYSPEKSQAFLTNLNSSVTVIPIPMNLLDM